jgi:D-alanyl-D-alanine carboxypeptidase
MTKKTILIAFFICICISSIGQPKDTRKLDRYFSVLDSAGKFMGSVAIMQDGKIFYQRALGFSDVASGKMASTETRYRVGSITKTFTAVLVMRTVEKGRISLDQTIDKWYPSIRNAERITIRHLLSHRSGIHNFTDQPGYQNWQTRAMTEQQLTDTIISMPVDFEPGSKMSYSNSGYLLLTYILQKIWNKSYGTLLNQHILKPVGMKDTRYGGKIAIENNDSRSYRFMGNWINSPETDASIPAGAGAIVSTTADIVKFADRLFSGKLISDASLSQMKELKDNYGLALMRFPFFDKSGYGHTGGIDAFMSVYAYFPDTKTAYALCSNGATLPINDISIAILSSLYGRNFEIPDFRSVTLNPEELQKYLGSYVSKQIPLRIAFTRKGNKLISQATGQMPFELEAMGSHKFKFERAGILIEFKPDSNQMLLKQGGGTFLFSKE